jgi:transposase
MKTIAKDNGKISQEFPVFTIGLDLGDKRCETVAIDRNGDFVRHDKIATRSQALQKFFAHFPGARVVLEVGTHSPWISRLLAGMGMDVVIANPRKVRLIGQNERKNDRVDAELLARLGRVDPQLLFPIRHRGEAAQADLALLHSREALVRCRTRLINHARGQVKALGGRLPACSAPAFARKAAPHLPEVISSVLGPILAEIEWLTTEIRKYDYKVELLCANRYPETARLRQVQGVGPITALAYVLTLEDPARFARSRKVGPYLGLVSRQHDSADSRPQLRISKTGDEYLRRLLVNCAHYILGPFAPDCDLRRYGEAIAHKGGKNAKKRAVVAVARKLAVLLHRLWVDGQPYEPLRTFAMAA